MVRSDKDTEGSSDDSLAELSDQQVMTYIYEMSMALSQMASSRNLSFLSYLLEMAALEGTKPPRQI